jgi:hypothetical protein
MEWQRRGTGLSGKMSVQQARDLRSAITTRRVALEEWMNGRNGRFYQPAEAQKIMRDLESSGQIRTGPTAWQKMITDFTDGIKRAVRKVLDAIIGWLNGAAPAGPTQVPKFDERWIKFLFWSTVLSLLVVIGYMLWRTLGGRFGREGARREVRYLDGEDAELLLLPPDELRLRATRFADEGNFREALRHLYISLLLQLDARGVWRYDVRRTNWEHIRALRRSPSRAPLIEPLSDITRRFDLVRYGNAECSPGEWERFVNDVDTVEALTQQNETPVAAGVGS